MSLLCLSLAATLRCAGIPRTESIALLVPPAVEAVVSLFLIRTVWRNGRKRWLLVAEAWVFLILTIIDYASHAAVRNTSSLDIFEPMDKATGVLSFGPILLYMSFLFLLTRADLLPLITPASLRTTFQFAIFSFIPPVIMSNELGSLLGVSYRLGPSSVPEIGFLNPTARSLSLAFTKTTVALLATFQLLIFFLCTWRISQAWAGNTGSQPVFVSATRTRRDSSTSDSYLGDERGVRGLSWLALALALGATETLLAFGPQDLTLLLIRRILRVFARGFLMYSLVRGSSDGFSNLEAGQPEMTKTGGIRALISNPRFSTFAHLTPNATSFYGLPRAGGRPADANPFADPTRNMTPESRVTVLYDQKSAPVLQMRFSGLDVPDSSDFAVRSIRSNSNGTRPTSLAGHGSHATSTPARSRSRTLSEKRAGPPLASIHIPEQAILAGVVPIQSANSSRSSVPPVPPLPGLSKLYVGSMNRSNSMSTSGEGTIENVNEPASQFPGLPPRAALRRGPTQLAYAVEEEDELPSSQNRSRSRSTSRSHVRTNTADSNMSALSSASRRKPVPAHTPGGTVIDLPSTNQERRPSVAQSNSGEQVVVETHSALFPDEQTQEYYASSTRSSARSSSASELTSTLTPSPAEILTRRPARLAERVAQLERQTRLSGEEHSWMRGREMPVPVPMSQSTVVSRTPEILMTDTDYESSRVELEGVASPKSPWSAKAPWPTTASTSRPTMGLPANPRAGRPGSNVEGWGRKLSDAGSIPTLKALAAEEQDRGRDNPGWKEGEVLGRYEGEYVRRSLVSSRRGSSASDPFVGDRPHAM